jgi:hypothetical protein
VCCIRVLAFHQDLSGLLLGNSLDLLECPLRPEICQRTALVVFDSVTDVYATDSTVCKPPSMISLISRAVSPLTPCVMSDSLRQQDCVLACVLPARTKASEHQAHRRQHPRSHSGFLLLLRRLSESWQRGRRDCLVKSKEDNLRSVKQENDANLTSGADARLERADLASQRVVGARDHVRRLLAAAITANIF